MMSSTFSCAVYDVLYMFFPWLRVWWSCLSHLLLIFSYSNLSCPAHILDWNSLLERCLSAFDFLSAISPNSVIQRTVHNFDKFKPITFICKIKPVKGRFKVEIQSFDTQSGVVCMSITVS